MVDEWLKFTSQFVLNVAAAIELSASWIVERGYLLEGVAVTSVQGLQKLRPANGSQSLFFVLGRERINPAGVDRVKVVPGENLAAS